MFLGITHEPLLRGRVSQYTPKLISPQKSEHKQVSVPPVAHDITVTHNNNANDPVDRDVPTIEETIDEDVDLYQCSHKSDEDAPSCSGVAATQQATVVVRIAIVSVVLSH